MHANNEPNGVQLPKQDQYKTERFSEFRPIRATFGRTPGVLSARPCLLCDSSIGFGRGPATATNRFASADNKARLNEESSMLCKWPNITAALALAIGCTSSPTIAQMAQAGRPLSREQLLFAVESSRSRVRDLQLTFTFDTQGPPSFNYLGSHTHHRVILSGNRIYSDFEFGTAQGPGAVRFRNESAYNGALSTRHTPSNGRAVVTPGLDRGVMESGNAFLDFTMMNPSRPNGKGFDDGSLISLLNSSTSVVRPTLERLGESLCHVIDARLPEQDHPVLTVWVDGERGFAPVQQVFYTKAGDRLMDFRMTDLRQFDSDL